MFTLCKCFCSYLKNYYAKVIIRHGTDIICAVFIIFIIFFLLARNKAIHVSKIKYLRHWHMQQFTTTTGVETFKNAYFISTSLFEKLRYVCLKLSKRQKKLIKLNDYLDNKWQQEKWVMSLHIMTTWWSHCTKV